MPVRLEGEGLGLHLSDLTRLGPFPLKEVGFLTHSDDNVRITLFAID
jgi:hypothetical protein